MDILIMTLAIAIICGWIFNQIANKTNIELSMAVCLLPLAQSYTGICFGERRLMFATTREYTRGNILDKTIFVEQRCMLHRQIPKKESESYPQLFLRSVLKSRCGKESEVRCYEV